MKVLFSERLALHCLLAILFATTVFHVLVAVGVVPYGVVWGSRLHGRSQMLAFEAASLTITLLMLAAVAVRVGYVRMGVPRWAMTVVFSLMFLLFLANTAGNLASNNEFEKLIFTPLTLLLALLSLRVAVGSASAQAGKQDGAW